MKTKMSLDRTTVMKPIYIIFSATLFVISLLFAYCKGHVDGKRVGIAECWGLDVAVLVDLEQGNTARAKRNLSVSVSGGLDYIDSKNPWRRAWETWRPGQIEELLERKRERAEFALEEYRKNKNKPTLPGNDREANPQEKNHEPTDGNGRSIPPGR
ncbi:MAG: hypothetical protein J0M04_10800 [Verrucomicrobia bacterium]|nr:hypothetical protein [Verrucomicrobiota bacterium]